MSQFSADLYLVMVPLKELQETGLGARGPLDPPETQIIAGSLQVAHVHGQVLQPQTCPLSHRGQLGGPVGQGRHSKGHQANQQSENTANGTLYSDSLVVCEAQRGEVGIFLGKVCQPVNDSGQL